jgi:hypothetical protein
MTTRRKRKSRYSLAHKAGTGAVDESAEMDEEDEAGIDLEDLDVEVKDYDDEEYFSSNEDDADAEDNVGT